MYEKRVDKTELIIKVWALTVTTRFKHLWMWLGLDGQQLVAYEEKKCSLIVNIVEIVYFLINI